LLTSEPAPAAVRRADDAALAIRQQHRQAIGHHHRAGDAALGGPAGIGLGAVAACAASSADDARPCTCFRNTGCACKAGGEAHAVLGDGRGSSPTWSPRFRTRK
jgi:hypothetical protein